MDRAADTVLIPNSLGSMIAVFQEEDENSTYDATPQFLLLILCKVVLNTLVMCYWLKSISKTLLGICSISIYLVDVLLSLSIAGVWLFGNKLDTHKAMCFILSHTSMVYSLLPLPILLAGALDCAIHQGFGQKSLSRTAVHCVGVLLIWTMACFYSSRYTNSELFTIQYTDRVKSTGCNVQESVTVSQFCLNVFIILSFVLLFHCRKLTHWVCLANKLAKLRTNSMSVNGLSFSRNLEKVELEAGEERHMGNLQDRPHLIISLALCFAVTWTPYLLLCIIKELVGLTVPAYASVNLLWTACTNSLLVGVTFWYRHEHLYTLPDDICSWSIYWHLSMDHGQFTASSKFTDEQHKKGNSIDSTITTTNTF